MDDAALHEIYAMLRQTATAVERDQQMIAGLAEALAGLCTMLVARGDLNDGQVSLLRRLGDKAHLATQPHVELNLAPDKRAVVNAEVDCASLMHLCHGRCCAYNIKLSEEDLLEGKLAWRVHQPYFLAQNDDGYCVYQVRETGYCGTYENRPATCRSYSCVTDQRVWIDFEKRIPAPMASGLVTIRRHPR